MRRASKLRPSPFIASSFDFSSSIPRHFLNWLALATGLAITTPPRALGVWPSDPALELPIVQRPGEQVLPKIAVTPDGTTYVGWFDNSAGSYDVYLQRLDAAGNETWTPGGILVSDHPQSTSLVDWDLIADSDGNAILVFTDTRDGGDLDVFAYRIDASGVFLWGEDGLQLSSNADFDPSPAVSEASDGDFVIVWPHLPDGADGALRIQRVSPAGATLLAPGGLDLVTAAGESPGFCRIEASDSGSALVSYVRDIDNFLAPRHVRLVKADADGDLTWGPIAVFDLASVPIGYLPQLRSDGSGGAVLTWHRSIANAFNACVQRVSSAGAELWPHNGVLVSTLANRYHLNPTCAFVPATGETFVFWNEETTNQNQWGIRGQKITAAGTRAWTDDGLAFVPMSATFRAPPRAVPTDDGSIVLFADEPTGAFGDQRVHAFRTGPTGNVVWGVMDVATTLSTKSRLPVAVDGSGVVRAIWEDDRNGTPDIYGQALQADGTLGVSSASATDGIPNPTSAVALGPHLIGSPNPFRTETVLQASTPRAAGTAIRIVDAAGRTVRTLGLDEDARARWDGRDALGRATSPGVYFLRALSGRSLGRIVRID